MPRRKLVSKRRTTPDLKYGNKQVAKFINSLMSKGKKSVAESILYGALDIIHQKTNDDPLQLFRQALNNVKPLLEVKSRRVGGSTYQVPVDVRPDRRLSLAIRWLITQAKQRSGKSMKEKMAAELLDASAGRGGSIKKKEDTHKMAEANRAFAHYRW